jgi:hypothetical protein
MGEEVIMDFLQGVVHGRIIELDGESGFPDGQRVSLVVQPSDASPVEKSQPPREGLRASFGAWAEDADELDAYLDWNRRQRKIPRPEMRP